MNDVKGHWASIKEMFFILFLSFDMCSEELCEYFREKYKEKKSGRSFFGRNFVQHNVTAIQRGNDS